MTEKYIGRIGKERSEFKPQPETRTGIVGPVTPDPKEAIHVDGPAWAEVVTNLDFGVDGPLLILPSCNQLGFRR